jgi:hypothetical protein
MVRERNYVVVLTMTEFSSKRLSNLFVDNMFWIIYVISMLSEVYALFFLCVFLLKSLKYLRSATDWYGCGLFLNKHVL